MGNDTKYYRICLRHMGKNDNCFLLWGHDYSGYYRSVEDCGFYTEKQANSDDPIVSKELVDKYKQKVVLPQYGDKKEEYAGRNEFYVLPNTGQVRKALGLTILDIQLDGDRNSFDAYFEDEIREVFKDVKVKGRYVLSLKSDNPFTNEYFYYQNEEYEAENRNKAIFKFIKDRDLEYSADDWKFTNRNNTWRIELQKDLSLPSILLAKKYVTCRMKKKTVFDKWKK